MTLSKDCDIEKHDECGGGGCCLFIFFLFFFFNSAQAWFMKHLPTRLSRKQNTSGLNEIWEGLK